jgi:DNA-binding LytR/AlgR family response regulator
VGKRADGFAHKTYCCLYALARKQSNLTAPSILKLSKLMRFILYECTGDTIPIYKVILTTAYHQYALEGYELSVLDYLLKPIEFSRFLKAVQKFPKGRGPEPFTSIPEQNQPSKFRFFNVNKKMVKVALDDILYLESLKEYIKIYTSMKRLTTKYSIGEVLRFLNDPRFLRIHRSFIINLDQIEAFSATEIEIGGQELPIGRSYRSEVTNRLKALRFGND